MRQVTIISAVGFEQSPLVEGLSKLGLSVSSLTTGIGPLNAAKSAQRLGDQVRGQDAIFIGTCGVFGDFHAPELVTAKRIIWNPTGVRLGDAYLVAEQDPDIELVTGSLTAPLPLCDVICSPGISLRGGLKTAEAARQVENLELYSVAAEIMRSAKSFEVLLCITNSVGADAHKQWKHHFPKAAAMSAAYICERIEAAQ